jgi:hypothetical protein
MNDIKQELEKIGSAYMECFNRQDAAGIAALYAKGGMHINPAGPRTDMTMKLGLAIGYSGAHLDVPVALVQRAEELGYDSVWSAEAYGSDAITPLAFLAAKTNRIKLGTGIMHRAGSGKSLKDFTIQASVHVEVDNDVKGALTRLKPEVALYVGGMGHRTKNFHNDIMVRRGFGDAAKRIQELYLAVHKAEVIATVPDEWVDLKSLVGPPARIRERYRAWEDSAGSLSARSGQPEAIEVMAKAARLN